MSIYVLFLHPTIAAFAPACRAAPGPPGGPPHRPDGLGEASLPDLHHPPAGVAVPVRVDVLLQPAAADVDSPGAAPCARQHLPQPVRHVGTAAGLAQADLCGAGEGARRGQVGEKVAAGRIRGAAGALPAGVALGDLDAKVPHLPDKGLGVVAVDASEVVGAGGESLALDARSETSQ